MRQTVRVATFLLSAALASSCGDEAALPPIDNAAGALCSSLTLAASPGAPTAVGTTVALTASAGCTAGDVPAYAFLVRAPGATAFTSLRSWSTSNRVDWPTAGRAPGVYTLRAQVRRQGQTKVERRVDVSYELADPGGPTACSGALAPILNLAYAPTHARTALDLYQPATGAACPLIVWIHGGGWQNGDKALSASSAAATRLLPFRDRGYAIASINYRLSGDALFPAQIQDVKAAIRFLRANAATFRLDPARIAAWGFSAGGHLAALLGTSDGTPALEDPSQGNSDVSSRVQAVVDCSGPIDLPGMDAELVQNGCAPRHDMPSSPESKLLGCAEGLQVNCPHAATANPTTYVGAGDPPFLFGHGKADCNIPWQQSRGLADALVGAGISASVHLAQTGGHDIIEACPSDATIAAFLSSVLE